MIMAEGLSLPLHKYGRILKLELLTLLEHNLYTLKVKEYINYVSKIAANETIRRYKASLFIYWIEQKKLKITFFWHDGYIFQFHNPVDDQGAVKSDHAVRDIGKIRIREDSSVGVHFQSRCGRLFGQGGASGRNL